MTLRGIDHINLRAPADQIEQLRAFYEGALGLAVGPRPPFGSFGYWLYAGGAPLVHLQAVDPGEERLMKVTTTLDHVAFAATDFDAATRRLEALGLPHTTRRVPLTGARQVFLRDPAGNGIELLFADID